MSRCCLFQVHRRSVDLCFPLSKLIFCDVLGFAFMVALAWCELVRSSLLSLGVCGGSFWGVFVALWLRCRSVASFFPPRRQICVLDELLNKTWRERLFIRFGQFGRCSSLSLRP